VVFNQETVIGNWWREMIAPGAFKRVLSEKPDVVAALNHNWDMILGRTTAGTLSLEATEEGLRYSIDINPEDTEAMNTYRKVKRGDVNQASFAFTVRKEEWVRPSNPSELPLRIINEVGELYDVGPCTAPTQSSGAIKASEFQHPGQRELVGATPARSAGADRNRAPSWNF
jgi:HK97 family phage prohead protease